MPLAAKKSTATFAVHGHAGVILIDNPPVNAISPKVVADLSAAFAVFEATAGLAGLVIHCAGRTFVAGGDIASFKEPGFSAKPFNSLLARIEACEHPVVACLHGTVLGGGLELAMACHYRIAKLDTRLGMPEITLGLIPGSLGTQRLPRLVGLPFAVDMVRTGRMIGAAQAEREGLVDAIVPGDVLDGAIAAVISLAEAPGSVRRTSLLTVPPFAEEDLAGLETEAAEKLRYPAFGALARCMRAAAELPFAEGEEVEALEFVQLLTSPVSLALRYQFFAQRDAAKIPGLDAEIPARRVERVGIVGAGMMGSGIAMAFANAGLPVVVIDTTAETLARGLEIVRNTYEESATTGRLTTAQVDQRMGLITGALDYAALEACDLVIEAVFEDLSSKMQVCALIGAAVKPGAIIATSTSTLDVNVLAEASGRAADFLGLHVFGPANAARLLEVIFGDATKADVLRTAMKVAQRLGKIAILSGAGDGFIGNRMADVYMREAEFLLMEGAEPSEIDAAMETMGMAVGPCRMLDRVGLDVAAKTVIDRCSAGQLPPDPSYRAIVRKLVDLGRLGQKTKAGFYGYDVCTPVPAAEVSQLADTLAAEFGIARRNDISREEIIERLMYPLINEGLRILEEGIALRPGDIDVVWVVGHGFPDHLGGPLFMADQLGTARIAERIAYYGAKLGNSFGYWSPAPLLTRLSREGRRIAEWNLR